jgi:hypothetical protein
VKRFRLVTVQSQGLFDLSGSRHVSSVILTEDEAHQSLETEREMHEAAGWFAFRRKFEREKAFEPTPYNELVCRRDGVTRIISIESFDAMDDHLST